MTLKNGMSLLIANRRWQRAHLVVSAAIPHPEEGHFTAKLPQRRPLVAKIPRQKGEQFLLLRWRDVIIHTILTRPYVQTNSIWTTTVTSPTIEAFDVGLNTRTAVEELDSCALSKYHKAQLAHVQTRPSATHCYSSAISYSVAPSGKKSFSPEKPTHGVGDDICWGRMSSIRE